MTSTGSQKFFPPQPLNGRYPASLTPSVYQTTTHTLSHLLDHISLTILYSLIQRREPQTDKRSPPVRKDGDLILAGHGPSQHNLERLYASAETATGELLTIVQDPPQQDGDPDSNKLVKHASLSSWSSGANPESVFTCHPKARQIAAFNTGFVILHADGTVSTFGDPRFEACLGRDTDAPNP